MIDRWLRSLEMSWLVEEGWVTVSMMREINWTSLMSLGSWECAFGVLAKRLIKIGLNW